jgi:hypothetical protein
VGYRSNYAGRVTFAPGPNACPATTSEVIDRPTTLRWTGRTSEINDRWPQVPFINSENDVALFYRDWGAGAVIGGVGAVVSSRAQRFARIFGRPRISPLRCEERRPALIHRPRHIR